MLDGGDGVELAPSGGPTPTTTTVAEAVLKQRLVALQRTASCPTELEFAFGGSVMAVAWSADSTHLAIGACDRELSRAFRSTVSIVDAATGAVVREVRGCDS